MSAPAGELLADCGSEYLEIASLLTAFLTSDRDHRSLLPDVFEMLVRNLSLDALLYYAVAEKSGAPVLHLDYQVYGAAYAGEGMLLPRYEVLFATGITGRTAASGESSLILPGGDLHGESDLEVFSDQVIRTSPLLEKEKTFGVLTFISKPDGATHPEPFFKLVVNIISSYMLTVHARQESFRTKRKFTLLNNYRRIFAGSFEIRSVLSAFMNLTASVLGAEVGICLLSSEDAPEPWLEVNWGLSRKDLDTLADSEGKGVLDLVKGQAVVRRCSNSPDAPLFRSPGPRGVTIMSLMAGPLFSKEKLIGIILFANKDVRPGETQNASFDEQDEELFEIVLEQARVFVENYLLYGKVIEMNDLNLRILESIDSGVVTLDLSGRILSCNKRAVDIAGAGDDDLVGKHIHEIFPISDFEPSTIIVRAALEKPQEVPDHEFERGGQVMVFSFIISPMRGEGEAVTGFVVTMQDRTGQVMLERHMRRADKLAALGELSAGLAHEIKNPLTAIKGFAQILPSRYSDGDFMNKFSHMLGNELMRIDELTERLLTFARPNIGGMRTIVLEELIEDAVLLAKYQLEKAGITHEIDICSPPPKVTGSPSRLSQVFLNIIINGLHAMNSGGALTIRIFRRFYSLPERGGIHAVLIDFTDTGDGIPEENLDRVFNPFFTTRETGTGLGLAISYRIIEEHGGSMEVRSTPGQGTRMRVILPELEAADA